MAIFEFKSFTIRCLEMEDGIWFFAKDVAKILGYKNEYDAIGTHTSISDRKALSFRDSRDSRESNISSLWENEMDKKDKILINESGLYCMIFGSKLESAEEFKLWVTGTVLPSIRKHGGYVLDQELLTGAQQEKLLKKVEKLSDEVKELKAKNTKLKARRSELLKESVEIKAALNKQKMNVAALNECAMLTENLNSKLFEEIEALKRKLKPVPTQKYVETPDSKTYRVDSNGFVVNDSN